MGKVMNTKSTIQIQFDDTDEQIRNGFRQGSTFKTDNKFPMVSNILHDLMTTHEKNLTKTDETVVIQNQGKSNSDLEMLSYSQTIGQDTTALKGFRGTSTVEKDEKIQMVNQAFEDKIENMR